MSKSQTLRTLVNERLTAAAEEIFALFERTMAEYEEELCRSKEENQRTQQRLEEVLSHRVHTPSPSPPPGPGLDQNITETAQIKEEQGVKQEEDQLPVSVPESSTVCVKRKESSMLQQRQTKEYRDKTRGEDINSETEGYTVLSFDFTDNWEPPFSCSAAQMETEADGDHYNQVQSRDRSTKLSPRNMSAQEMGATVHSGDLSETGQGAERKKHQCSVCTKRFWSKNDLQRHIRVHTGDRPYSCSICQKTFALKGALNVHRRRHTDKPCNCPICNKEFTNSCNLKRHIRTHTGEKPYSCSFCNKQFNQSSNLKRHMRIHVDGKPELNTEWLRDVSCVQVPF